MVGCFDAFSSKRQRKRAATDTAKAAVGVSLRDADKDGDLEEWASYWRGWRPVHATLHSGVLFVTKLHKEGDASRTSTRIDLQACAIVSGANTVDDASRFTLDNGIDVYHFRTATPEAREEWLAALNQTKHYYDQLVLRSKPTSHDRGVLNTLSGATYGQTTTLWYDAQDKLSHNPSMSSPIADLNTSTSKYESLLAELIRLRERLQRADMATLARVERLLGRYGSGDWSTPLDGASNPGLLGVVSLALNVLTCDGADHAHCTVRITELENKNEQLKKRILQLERQLGYAEHSNPSPHIKDPLDHQVVSLREAPDSNGGWQILEEMPSISTQKPRRLRLPYMAGSPPKASIWSALKDCIGKDLTKISLPVTFNEPLTLLQRSMEDLEYHWLLDAAAQEDDPIQRLVYIGIFSVSFYSSMERRLGKPFNPLLGETFEYEDSDRKLKYISEQVSHHPPISAAHCHGNGWDWSSSLLFKTAFWGKSAELIPKGCVRVAIPRYNEVYTWQKATSCMHNVIFGTMWLEHYGEIVVTSQTTGCKAQMRLHKGSGDRFARVTANILDAQGEAVRTLWGNWNQVIFEGPEPGSNALSRLSTMSSASKLSILPSTSRLTTALSAQSLLDCAQASSMQPHEVWRKNPPPSDPRASHYRMTEFAVTLNEPDADVAPTDSRWRPDVRAMDDGDYDKSESEKRRLEVKQRSRRTQSKAAHTPLWFAVDPQRVSETDLGWVYGGEYFTAKAQQFADTTFPDLY
eukprot:jgi/Chlat1/5394/Chrsp35S05306